MNSNTPNPNSSAATPGTNASEPRSAGEGNGNLENAVRASGVMNQSSRSSAAIVPHANPAMVPSRLLTSTVVVLAIGVLLMGWALNLPWLSLAGSLVTVAVFLSVLWSSLRQAVLNLLSAQKSSTIIISLGAVLGSLGLLKLVGVDRALGQLLGRANWDAVGALGEVFGALGQILIAILAVYIAWRQYVIEKDLTTQQNVITQQQTIDSYFQGISDLVLDEEGLLEDWPQERAIAEGRTAAILSSVDAGGKAKIIRFLSRARLLTPLKRDQRLGRAILDGTGGYAEDRDCGVRVIDLGVMLAGADLAGTDLRWTDLSEVNLIRADLSHCDLVKTNLSRTVLVDANLRGVDLNGARLFYGKAETASPRSRTEPPNYRTGEHTGAVVEGADFTGALHMSEELRHYCCAWGGAKTRRTIPGGCQGIPTRLGG